MISIISLFLELLLVQFIPKNLFIIPLFTIVSIFFLKKKNYYLFLFLLGFIYDLFFTEVIFLHSIIFILLGLIITLFKKNLLLVLFIITLYQVLLFVIYSLLNLINIDIKEFLYILSHYYVLNIIYYYILRIIYKNKS